MRNILQSPNSVLIVDITVLVCLYFDVDIVYDIILNPANFTFFLALDFSHTDT